tara:strand:+ start:1528 stop:2016 length:489 start_codon:yes stop_codon:yes gene_type:complete
MKIKIGEQIPNTDLFYLNENNAVQKIQSHLVFKEKKIIIIGVPGAFTKVCSSKHLPGYIDNYDEIKKKGVKKIICISVNDPNVMKAWGDQQKVQDKIFMAADPFCEFTKLIGADVDKSSKGLGIRSSRYTMLIEDKIVKIIQEEEDTGICEISAAVNFTKRV